MYAGSTIAVRCAVEEADGFQVEVGLHQKSALSPMRSFCQKARKIDHFQ